jgi:hypothetical protein
MIVSIFMKLLGYDSSSSFGSFLFELCDKHNIMPIEYEVYFSKFFEQCPLLFFLLLETLNHFLLTSTPLFYMGILSLQLSHCLLEFLDPFSISSDFNLEFKELFRRCRLIQIYGNCQCFMEKCTGDLAKASTNKDYQERKRDSIWKNEKIY